MKNKGLICILLVIMLLLCACSSQSVDSAGPSAAVNKTDAPAASGPVSQSTAAPTDTPSPEHSAVPTQTKAPESTAKPTPTPTPSGGSDKGNTCTVEIRCDTAVGKSGKAPSSGVILGRTAVSFDDGESVYTVLKSACDANGISLGGSGSYVSSIAGLAERDCGGGSGWLYKVNGVFMSVGCGSCTVEDGDVIVWLYTCDMGADL